MTHPECQSAQADLASIKTKYAEFEASLALAQTAVSEEEKKQALTKAKEIKAFLEKQTLLLQEKINPLERLVGLKEQYRSQIDVLKEMGVLTELSSGELGIVDILDREVPVPTYQEVLRRTNEQRELLTTKVEQGFTTMHLVPFGASLGTAIEEEREDKDGNKTKTGFWQYTGLLSHYAQALLERYDSDPTKNRLYRTKQNPGDPDEPVTTLDTNQPLFIWEELNDADKNGQLVYHPEQFTLENHGGQTKAEILTNNPAQAWQIIFTEDQPNLPREDPAKTLGGRTQIDTTGTTIRSVMESGAVTPNPQEYLKALQEIPEYQGEKGLTPEDWLILALTHLHETNQVFDDWQGKGRASWLTAAYHTSSYVPRGYWDSGDGRVYLFGYVSRIVLGTLVCGLR